MEYPGYGVYNCPKNELTILKDSLILFDFIIDTLKFAPENVIVFGRSIGTGPATYLASQRKNIKMLLLFSPFTRLKEIVKDYFSILSIFFKDRFPNVDYMEMVMCPLLVIHGKQDKIIKCDHSYKLLDVCRSIIKKGHFPEMMGHNDFRLYDDLIIPFVQFLRLVEKTNISDQLDTSSVDMPNIAALEQYSSVYLTNNQNKIVESFESDQGLSNLKINNSSILNLKKTFSSISKHNDVHDTSPDKKSNCLPNLNHSLTPSHKFIIHKSVNPSPTPFCIYIKTIKIN